VGLQVVLEPIEVRLAEVRIHEEARAQMNSEFFQNADCSFVLIGIDPFADAFQATLVECLDARHDQREAGLCPEREDVAVLDDRIGARVREVSLLHARIEQHLTEDSHPLGVEKGVIVAEHHEFFVEVADLFENQLGRSRDEGCLRVDATRAENARKCATDRSADRGYGILEQVEVIAAVAVHERAIGARFVVEADWQRSGFRSHEARGGADLEARDVFVGASTIGFRCADLRKGPDSLADCDQVDRGIVEILGAQGRVVSPHDVEAIGSEPAHGPQRCNRGLDVDDLGRHACDVRRERFESRLEVGRAHHHVDEAHFVLAGNTRTDEFEAKRLDPREILEADRAISTGRVDEQDLHAACFSLIGGSL